MSVIDKVWRLSFGNLAHDNQVASSSPTNLTNKELNCNCLMFIFGLVWVIMHVGYGKQNMYHIRSENTRGRVDAGWVDPGPSWLRADLTSGRVDPLPREKVWYGIQILSNYKISINFDHYARECLFGDQWWKGTRGSFRLKLVSYIVTGDSSILVEWLICTWSSSGGLVVERDSW